jgi:transcriptional regulator with XRE-family HTH domain
MSVGSRIKELRNSLDLTQQKFADRLGIQRGIIGKYEVDVSAPSDAVISLICREFNVREAWLRDGTGEMLEVKPRAEELGELVRKLLADRPESFRSRLITSLLRFEPDSPEWQILENIYNSIAAEKESRE